MITLMITAIIHVTSAALRPLFFSHTLLSLDALSFSPSRVPLTGPHLHSPFNFHFLLHNLPSLALSLSLQQTDAS